MTLDLDALEIRALRFHKLNPIHECFDSTTVLALIARVREAEREMHARELHHFEEEQKLAQAEAIIEKVRSMLPGPRTFAESLSRDFGGNLWPRTVDADEIAAALATYKPTNQEDTDA